MQNPALPVQPDVTGIGLITGKPCQVKLGLAIEPGIWFVWPDGQRVLASLQAIHATERGVTLLGPDGQTLSIVEHFLAACALVGVNTVQVCVNGPELPILDGSAAGWLDVLKPFSTPWQITHNLTQPVRVERGDSWLEAKPAPSFSITYTVDFNHPALQDKTVHWSPNQPQALSIATAGTFGSLAELPAMQAKGFALGVSEANTLGLLEDGSFTRPLRLPDEPVYHKILDCLGDLMLTGINPLNIGMQITAYKAGHSSHLLLAQSLAPHIQIQMP
jgi:UDP-3-O-[3-hydroxymyristoyl] N-acetylglucosamine deacetylase